MVNKDTFQYFRAPQQPVSPVVVVKPAGFTDAQRVLAVSLQGVVAKERPQIYIDYTGEHNTQQNCRAYLDMLSGKYGFSVAEQRDPAHLLQTFRDKVRGYILADFPRKYREEYGSSVLEVESLNVATSLAGLYDSVIVDESLVGLMEELEIPLVLDVRKKDMAWLLQRPEYQELNRKQVFQLDSLEHGRDYCIASCAVCFFSHEQAHFPIRQQIFEDMEPDTPVFGWSNALAGEDDSTMSLTESGHFWAAGYPDNLSFVTAFAREQSAVQKPVAELLPEDEQRHYVCILVSDGDNLEFVYKGLVAEEGQLFDSTARGNVPLGWGMPAALTELAPDILQYLYDRASDGSVAEGFVSYGSGGYMYPSHYPKVLLEGHVKKLARAMKRSDTNIVGIIDFDQFCEQSLELWDVYTRQEAIDAVFYVDYCSYATDPDAILWSNGKPVIASRARFWKGLPQSDIAYISQKINRLPRDPKNPNSYSLIMVHAWSRSLEEVAQLAAAFDEHVKIVTPKTFVKLITENVDRSVRPQKDCGKKDGLEFVLDTGDFCPAQQVLCKGEATVDRAVTLPYAAFANGPAGKAIATGYRLEEGARVTVIFSYPATISADGCLHFALYNRETAEKLIFRLLDQEVKPFWETSIVLQFCGWQFFAFPLDLTKEVLLGGYELESVGEKADFRLDECVVRGRQGRDYFPVSSPGADILRLGVGETFVPSVKRRVCSFDTFYASGAIFYYPSYATVEAEKMRIRVKTGQEIITIEEHNRIRAVAGGRAKVEIESLCCGQPSFCDMLEIFVVEKI